VFLPIPSKRGNKKKASFPFNITGSITLHKMQVYAFFVQEYTSQKSCKKDILAVSLISVWCETIKELELLGVAPHCYQAKNYKYPQNEKIDISR